MKCQMKPKFRSTVEAWSSRNRSPVWWRRLLELRAPTRFPKATPSTGAPWSPSVRAAPPSFHSSPKRVALQARTRAASASVTPSAPPRVDRTAASRTRRVRERGRSVGCRGETRWRSGGRGSGGGGGDPRRGDERGDAADRGRRLRQTRRHRPPLQVPPSPNRQGERARECRNLKVCPEHMCDCGCLCRPRHPDL